MARTEYFSDGSAIVVTERGILLLRPVARYEVGLPTKGLDRDEEARLTAEPDPVVTP
jgi:hypothetical protein